MLNMALCIPIFEYFLFIYLIVIFEQLVCIRWFVSTIFSIPQQQQQKDIRKLIVKMYRFGAIKYLKLVELKKVEGKKWIKEWKQLAKILIRNGKNYLRMHTFVVAWIKYFQPKNKTIIRSKLLYFCFNDCPASFFALRISLCQRNTPWLLYVNIIRCTDFPVMQYFWRKLSLIVSVRYPHPPKKVSLIIVLTFDHIPLFYWLIPKPLGTKIENIYSFC